MSQHQERDDRRLRELAASEGISTSDPRSLDVDLQTAQTTAADQQANRDALLRTRTVKFQSKSHLLRKSPSNNKPWKQEELSGTLETIIREGNCSSGQVLALLALGADPNISCPEKSGLVAKAHHGSRKATRSSALLVATRNRNHALMDLLIPRADKENLNDALNVAIQNKDPRAIKVLVQCEADPNVYHSAFQQLVKDGTTELVIQLSSGRKPISVAVATSSIVDAVNVQDRRLVQMLLWLGADVNWSQGLALQRAIKLRRRDVLLCLLMGRTKPSIDTLNLAFSVCVQEPAFPEEMRSGMLEILLAAGARGSIVDETVIKATERKNKSLLKLLVEYVGFDTLLHKEGEAIKQTMSQGDLELFKTMIGKFDTSKVPPGWLEFCLDQDSHVAHVTLTHMVAVLARRHPPQEELNKALVCLIGKGDKQAVADLLSKGASPDFNDGRSLQIAIESQRLDLAEALLPMIREQQTFLSGIQLLQHLPRGSRLRFAQRLLPCAYGPEVDALLLKCLQETTPGLDYGLIGALISNDADVNYHDGACFVIAVEREDLYLLQLLSKAKCDPLLLGRAVKRTATLIQDSNTQLKLIKQLVKAGASGTGVDEALPRLITSEPESIRLIRPLVLADRTNIEHANGSAVCKAVAAKNASVLELLLRQEPSPRVLQRGIEKAMEDVDEDFKASTIQTLLSQKHRPTLDFLDTQLINTAKRNQHGHECIKLFMKSGASVDFKNGEALRFAVETKDLDLFLLLYGLQAPTPNTFNHVLSTILDQDDEESKILFCRSALDIDGEKRRMELNSSLLSAFNAQSQDLRLLDLFLQRGAQVESHDFAAYQFSLDSLHFSAIKLLLKHLNSSTSFDQAWRIAKTKKVSAQILSVILEVASKDGQSGKLSRFQEEMDQLLIEAAGGTAFDFDLARLALKYGAQVSASKGQCLKEAVRLLDVTAVSLLLTSHKDTRETVSEAFDYGVSSGIDMCSERGLACAEFLLQGGASGLALDVLLSTAAPQYSKSKTCHKLVDTLVDFGAKTDFKNGMAIQEAMTQANPALLMKLLESVPSAQIVTQALPYLFRNTSQILNVQKCFEHVLLHFRGALDLNRSVQGFEPLIFMALRFDPKAIFLLDMLLENGASPNQRSLSRFFANVGEEHITACMEATIRSGPTSSYYEWLVKLVAKGANLNATSSISKNTCLQIAIQVGNDKFAEHLINSGANLSHSDGKGFTALALAARRGLYSTLRCLVDTGAPLDDGSLHEAVATCSLLILKLLLTQGHSPNFPSPVHGRTGALEYLIFTYKSNDTTDRSLFDTVKLLVDAGANLQAKRGGQSLLIQTFYRGQSAPNLVAALLNAGPKNFVNDAVNIFESSVVVASPLSYAQHYLTEIDTSVQAEIVRLLESAGCEKVWYHKRGTQPHDFEGAPAALKQQEEERLVRERRHRQEDEDNRRKLEFIQREACQTQDIRQQEHRLHLAQESEKVAERNRGLESTARLQLQLDQTARSQRQQNLAYEKSVEVQHQRQLTSIQLSREKESNRLQLEYHQTLAYEEQKIFDAKVRSERALADIRNRTIREEDDADGRKHVRNMKQIEANHAGVREQQKLLQAQQNVYVAQKAAAIQQQQARKQIEYSYGPD